MPNNLIKIFILFLFIFIGASIENSVNKSAFSDLWNKSLMFISNAETIQVVSLH